ncbi:MAG: radical SAM protein [Deltaproteobacteria bacterium]|nr:radical SAM protein [Deltaproteobacteria bacterium]
MESIYWVITLKCNDFCDHCYNDSGPQGEQISTDDLLQVLEHFPDNPGRIILSGGEITSDLPKLLTIMKAIRKRYDTRTRLWLQSNGDLINQKRLTALLEAGADRIDITSLDRYHQKKGQRRQFLQKLFEEAGMTAAIRNGSQTDDVIRASTSPEYAFWGADEDLWLGGNWARGRALRNGLALKDPEHNFCSLWSGAKGFLDHGSKQQEVHVQLFRLYPCCPTTLYAIADLRKESMDSALKRAGQDESMQLLNQGQVMKLGIREGLSPELIQERIKALGDVCLWCDEYFSRYQGSACKSHLLRHQPQQGTSSPRPAVSHTAVTELC